MIPIAFVLQHTCVKEGFFAYCRLGVVKLVAK